MQYLLMIYGDEELWASRTKEENEALYKEHVAFRKEFAGAIKGGNALQPTSVATTVRIRDGKTLTTDGPFAETKEQLGGFYLVEAANLDEAVAMAAKIPKACDGSIEVRPIMTFAAAQGGM
jgi:hypothetical protein